MKHVRVQCEPGCDCVVCRGGLFLCAVCNGAEGSLPTECPGQRMTAQQQDEIMAGRLDFVHGVWYPL